MNTLNLTLLTVLMCGIPALFVAVLFTWALCRAARDTRLIDEGQAFGGDYE